MFSSVSWTVSADVEARSAQAPLRANVHWRQRIFCRTQSQDSSLYTGGPERLAWPIQGLNRWGMNFVAGNLYAGTLEVSGRCATIIWVGLR